MSTLENEVNQNKLLDMDYKDGILFIPLSNININLLHIRKHSLGKDIEELANSIFETGLLHPILVKQSEKDSQDSIYTIICGERRFMAYKYLNNRYPNGFNKIPCKFIRTTLDPGIISLAENIQREPLTTLEESKVIFTLIDTIKKGYAEIGKLIGKSEDYVEKRIRYLRMHEKLKSRIETLNPDNDFYDAFDQLALSKVLMLKPLITHWTEKESYELIKRIIDEDLSLREIKNIIWIHQENRNQRRLALSSKDESDEFKLINDFGIDENLISMVQKDKSESKSIKKIVKEQKIKAKSIRSSLVLINRIDFSKDFWQAQFNLLIEKLNISIKKKKMFQDSFKKIILEYGNLS
ncbi:MAG: ParB/RepB/Spo0J family partition protein [Spirochaetota bacterium]|nr:ParB/RepB/Spo0J family partition protein [Spirochaetota bacterium]